MNVEEKFYEGFRLYTEAGDAGDLEKAFALLTEAADEGHALAQDILGNMYEDGDGAPLDICKAVQLYEKSAKQECPPGMYDLALLLMDGHGIDRNESRAFSLVKRAVELAQDPDHMFMLSVMYHHGTGVKADENIATTLLMRAEKLGSIDAKANLGAMYLSGEGRVKDHKKAFQLLREAADNDDCSALCNLALMYENGLSTKQDLEEAVSCYRKAAMLGYPPAFYHLGVLAGEGSIPVEDIDPVGLLKTAGADGNIDALYKLGVMYYDGNGVDPDLEMSAQYFRAGSEFENPECMYNLGIMIIRGEANEEYEDEALDLIIAAADAGYGPARELLEKSEEQ